MEDTPSRIVLVRHAPTEASNDGRFMGRMDWPLGPHGLQEAARARGEFASLTISGVICSPLRRAIETSAALFGETPTTIDGRVAERSLGVWENRPKCAVRNEWPSAFVEGVLDAQFEPPEGEPWPTFVSRVAAFFQDLRRRETSSGSVVVVTHNGVIRALRHIVEGRPLEDVFAQPEPHLVPIVLQPDPSAAPLESWILE
jgi:probable phosphoglycerate mutase